MSTTYLEPSPEGIGATVDEAIRLDPSTRHVMVCGPRPGGTALGLRSWVDASGVWSPVAAPWIGPESMRVRLGFRGREVTVHRVSGWFGDSTTPDDAAQAAAMLRHAVGKYHGARMHSSPAATGVEMLRAGWRHRRHEFPGLDGDVQTHLRSTSGQGRFELFDRGRERGGRVLHVVDARFQYAALAGCELPVGDPVESTGEPDRWAKAWACVEFEPAPGLPFGLLGVPWHEGNGRRWVYPTTGRHTTWTTWAEVDLAREHGYAVRWLTGYVWPRSGRPLRSWSAHVIRERDRMEGVPVRQGVREAVRSGLRAIVVQGVGLIHGRDAKRLHVVDDSRLIPDDAEDIRFLRSGRIEFATREHAAWRADASHPEWTSYLYGLARARLARQMLAQPAGSVVACALDAFYTDRPPVIGEDSGRAGVWRAAGRFGKWQAFGTLADLYSHTREG